jgi:hypothetical protein
MEKQKQQKCCTESNMTLLGYWYKNYISEFATRIIECKTCKRRFNKSGFENGLTVHSNIIGGTCILKDGRTVINKTGIMLNTDKR